MTARTKSASSLLLISFALALCYLTSSVSADDIQPPDEFSNLFFDDASIFAASPDLEEYYGTTTDFPNTDFFLADASDDTCEIGSSQALNKKGKRAHEECKTPSSILRSPINFPQFLQLSTDPQNSQDPDQVLKPDPDDLSLVYPFELPPDNYKICPKPTDGRLYAVCDSGIDTDNVYDRIRNTFNLRYCTLYNFILGCEDPHKLWCCQYYYLDTLAVELGIIDEGVGVGRYCELASFYRDFGLPLQLP